MTAPWTPPVLRTEPVEVVITPQQANVLSGLCCGHTYEQIGRRIGVARNTVLTHVKCLYLALGARNAAHAVALTCSGQVRAVVDDGRSFRAWERSA